MAKVREALAVRDAAHVDHAVDPSAGQQREEPGLGVVAVTHGEDSTVVRVMTTTVTSFRRHLFS